MPVDVSPSDERWITVGSRTFSFNTFNDLSSTLIVGQLPEYTGVSGDTYNSAW